MDQTKSKLPSHDSTQKTFLKEDLSGNLLLTGKVENINELNNFQCSTTKTSEQ